DHRQAEGRVLQRGRGRVVPRADEGRDLRLPPRPEPALCGGARPAARRAARPRARRRNGHEQLVRVAVRPDARGLALVVPPPGDRIRRASRSARTDRRVTGERLTYAVVTPVRNQAANIRRLAEAIAAQRVLPEGWVIVDTGSTDETRAIADELAESHDW